MFEAVLVQVIWPDFIAELEAGAYSNKLFVPIRFLDFTAGYDTNSAVLFPETIAMREVPKFTWGAIFADREAARFRAVVSAAAEITKLALPPDAARLLEDQQLTEETFVMWDLIHDRTHMHGDLPFDPFMIKQRMPYFLYSLEELRCDLTAFRESVALEQQGVPHARLVQYAVIFDRIFRFAITGTRVRNYDGLGGQLLFAWLHQHHVLHWTDNRLSIEWDKVTDAVLELGEQIESLYWRSIDRPKISHWLAAYQLVSGTLEPHPASIWAKGAAEAAGVRSAEGPDRRRVAGRVSAVDVLRGAEPQTRARGGSQPPESPDERAPAATRALPVRRPATASGWPAGSRPPGHCGHAGATVIAVGSSAGPRLGRAGAQRSLPGISTEVADLRRPATGGAANLRPGSGNARRAWTVWSTWSVATGAAPASPANTDDDWRFLSAALIDTLRHVTLAFHDDLVRSSAGRAVIVSATAAAAPTAGVGELRGRKGSGRGLDAGPGRLAAPVAIRPGREPGAADLGRHHLGDQGTGRRPDARRSSRSAASRASPTSTNWPHGSSGYGRWRRRAATARGSCCGD